MTAPKLTLLVLKKTSGSTALPTSRKGMVAWPMRLKAQRASRTPSSSAQNSKPISTCFSAWRWPLGVRQRKGEKVLTGSARSSHSKV
ncbi:unnamed protein product [Phytomonas sp. Hart1]|nr:unnamed protein product [Phytomonas sp. Hart1]|eukprot:CCW68069.1 unnamed protein product [Phytomonas sp. isolate Hart1]